MKQFKRITAVILVIVMLTANVAYAATGKVTTINMTNLFLAKKVLSEHDVEINIIMGEGEAACTCWGCDLTYDYVKINGDYRT